MFGGLIAHRGRIVACDADERGGMRLRVEAPSVVAQGVAPKDSIAIDGVCLTVAAHAGDEVDFDVVPETLVCSTLGELTCGAHVNVELSLRLGDRIGGHLIYGHVDATAPIVSKNIEGQGHRLAIAMPPALRRYVVRKGYVAVDGVSLTVAAAADHCFEIALIPETSARTSLGVKDIGARVNLEIDPVARYALAAATVYAAK